MVDRLAASLRSAIMSRIRGKNTRPERYMFVAMVAAGWCFDRHPRDVPGRPDVTFRFSYTAVFIDGDFWHGYRFPRWKDCVPEWWRDKIAGNRKRDQRVRRQLKRQGWTVVRIWEHQVEKDILNCLERIRRAAGLASVNKDRVIEELSNLPPLRFRNRLPRPRKEAR